MPKKLILILFTLSAVANVVLVLAVLKLQQFSAMAAAGANAVAPADVVTASPVREDTWETGIKATGSFYAVQGVTVAGEIAGKIAKISFDSGATVSAGDLLVQLDTSAEAAQLESAEAAAALAALNLRRQHDLRAQGTNSEADLDLADAQAKQAAALTAQLHSVIAKKTIRAPFAGRLGLRFVNLGQILNAGDPVTTLQTLDPIYVNFSVPQQSVAALVSGAEVHVASDAAPGAKLSGKITAISPEVDPVTRNVRVQATLGNGNEKLRPGMFASVEVMLPETKKVLAVPATAVLYAPSGDSVFVVDEQKNEKTQQTEKVLRQQFVQLGATRGDFVSVVSGLKPGETVVSSGVFKLRAKGVVVIDNKLAPDAQLMPKPNNS
ncbi:MAG: efflux RND transporter periplasmic adaptor subunit [Verrucomicrobiota bacterium]